MQKHPVQRSGCFLKLILKIASKGFLMLFEPKRLKDEEEYQDISTNPETVAGQTSAKTTGRLFLK